MENPRILIAFTPTIRDCECNRFQQQWTSGGWPMLSPHTKAGALPFSRSLREILSCQSSGIFFLEGLGMSFLGMGKSIDPM
jgi:hypothetical protein